MKKLLTAIAAASIAGAAQAATIVDWDGTNNDVLSGNESLVLTDTFSTGSGFQSPSIGASGYPGPTVVSPNFYAAISDTGVDSYRVHNGGGNDLLGRIQVSGATSGTFTSMLAWETGGVRLESFTMTGTGDFNASVTGSGMRMLFQASDNNWYASSEFADPAGTISIADASAASWFNFTPHTAGVATIGAAASGLDFSGVQLVGYYQEFTTTGGGGIFSTGFFATGTVVPEPGTLGLLAMGGIVMMMVRKKRG